MDIMEAIRRRKSIRGFKSDQIPKEVLVKILESACRAPSAMNTQPWDFVVLTGEVLNNLRTAIVDNLKRNVPAHPEHHSVGWSGDGIFRNRQIELAKELFRLMGIPREDKEKRAAWLERGFRFFDAPVAIIITTDSSLSDVGPLLDLGAAMQTICLAALDFGLGTCIEDQGVLYPDVVRNIANMKENKRIIISIAIGYPNWDFPANNLESRRESLDENTQWIGF